jgi:hypothetical protein
MAAWFAAVAVSAAAAGVIFVLLLAPQRPAVHHPVPVPAASLPAVPAVPAVPTAVQPVLQRAAPQPVLSCPASLTCPGGLAEGVWARHGVSRGYDHQIFGARGHLRQFP